MDRTGVDLTGVRNGLVVAFFGLGSAVGLGSVVGLTFAASAQTFPPSDDADALARLAPPSRRSTELQTYGDASYGRAHMAGRPYRGYGYGTAKGYGYAYQPPADGYRPWYTDFPAYVSAPQIYKRVPGVQTPILPLGDH